MLSLACLPLLPPPQGQALFWCFVYQRGTPLNSLDDVRAAFNSSRTFSLMGRASDLLHGDKCIFFNRGDRLNDPTRPKILAGGALVWAGGWG